MDVKETINTCSVIKVMVCFENLVSSDEFHGVAFQNDNLRACV